MRKARPTVLAALLGYLSCPSHSAAAPAANHPAVEADAPSRLDEAERLFEEAERAAKAGDHGRALDLMQQSYEACGRQAQLLFNLGVLQQQLGRSCEAIASFEGYLAADGGAFRDEARQALAALDGQCATRAPLPNGAGAGDAARPVTPASPRPVESRIDSGAFESKTSAASSVVPPSVASPSLQLPEDRGAGHFLTPERAAAISALALGGLAAATSVRLALNANASDDQLDELARASRDRPPSDRAPWSATARALADERDADRTRAVVFGSASALLFGAGVTLLLLSGKPSEPGKTAVAVDVAPQRVAARVVWSAF